MLQFDGPHIFQRGWFNSTTKQCCIPRGEFLGLTDRWIGGETVVVKHQETWGGEESHEMTRMLQYIGIYVWPPSQDASGKKWFSSGFPIKNVMSSWWSLASWEGGHTQTIYVFSTGLKRFNVQRKNLHNVMEGSMEIG